MARLVIGRSGAPRGSFHANTGGHAPTHVRRMLYAYLETGEMPVDLIDENITGPDPLRWLTGQLWNCTDPIPGEIRQRLVVDDAGLAPWTCAQAARAIRRGQLGRRR